MALIADWHRWDSFHRSLHWIVSCKWRRHLCPKLSHKTVWLSQCTNMWNPNIFQCRLAGWHLLVYFHWLTILTDVHSAVWLLSFQASNSSGRTCIHGNLMKQFNLQCDYNLFFFVCRPAQAKRTSLWSLQPLVSVTAPVQTQLLHF